MTQMQKRMPIEESDTIDHTLNRSPSQSLEAPPITPFRAEETCERYA